jgi:predicted RND superfamily exporter protein
MDNEEMKNSAKEFASAMKEQYSQMDSSKKQRNILIVVIILLLCGLAYGYQQYKNLNVDLTIANQNEKALADSVRVSKNKVGELVYSKNILVAEKNNLESLSKDLADELKDEKGKVHQLTKYVVELKQRPKDTVKITNTLIKYADGSNGLEWKYDTIFNDENERHIAGISKFRLDSTGKVIPLQTELTKDYIRFNIIQGLREKDGNVEMFVRSDYPDFALQDLQSAIIDPDKHPVLKKYTKKKKWGIGPMVGVGLGVNTWPTPNVGFGIMVGVSVQYSLFQF